MGCGESKVRGDGQPVNPAHLPAVPENSWYALAFGEPSSMVVTEFHQLHKGHCLFSKTQIPIRDIELDRLPNRAPEIMDTFTLGEDTIYGMGYLHDSSLFIEHHWRTRVSWEGMSSAKYDKPFYNTLLAVKVFINNVLVPDSDEKPDSVPHTTATVHAAEGLATWRAVPLVLCGDLSEKLVKDVHVYRGLMFSFLRAAHTLEEGEHTVRTEVVYGCRKDANFVTEFISRGAFELVVTPHSRELISPRLSNLAVMMDSNPPHIVPNRFEIENCVFCTNPRKYTCTVCGAQVCGTPQCVWSTVTGYPVGCPSHRAVVN